MRMIPLTPELISTYNRVGTESYDQHYLHLWTDNDPSEYINSSFTPEVVTKEMQDLNLRHFLIAKHNTIAGILKLVIDAPIGTYSARQAILLEKIYLLKKFSGQGLGEECIRHIIELSVTLGKEILWLDTMQKGKALKFYLQLGFEIFGERLLHFSNAIDDERPMYQLRYFLPARSE